MIFKVTSSNQVQVGNARQTAISTSHSGFVIIPSEVNGCQVTAIAPHAFEGCTGVESLSIPASIEHIATDAFGSDFAPVSIFLRTLVAPSIDEHCFSDAVYNNTILYKEVNTDTDAFNATPWSRFSHQKICSSNQNDMFTAKTDEGIDMVFALTNGVLSVGNSGSTENPEAVELTTTGSITIPQYVCGYNVTSIGAYAFAGCKQLSSVVVSPDVQYIGSHAFSGCTGITSILMPSGLGTIEEATFLNCTGLKQFAIPGGVYSIGAYAFKGCTALESCSLPSSLMYLRLEAFCGTALQTLTLPKNLVSIGSAVLFDCPNLTSVTSLIEKPQALDITFVDHSKQPNVKLYVPMGTRDEYLKWQPWNLFKTENIIELEDNGSTTINPDDDEEIGTEDGDTFTAFTIEGAELLYKIISAQQKQVELVGYANPEAQYEVITIPGHVNGYTVVSIGSYAVSVKGTLKTVTIEEGVRVLKDGAFRYNPVLSNVQLPSSLRKIDYFVFSASGIQTIEIPHNVYHMEGGVFFDCTELTFISFSNALTEIPDNTCKGCKKLGTVILPNKVKNIGGWSFSEAHIASLDIPATIESIELSAIENSTIGQLYIRKFIDPGVFRNATRIASMVYDGTEFDTAWCGDAGPVETLIFGPSVQTLYCSRGPFSNYIRKIVFNDKIKAIGNNMFSYFLQLQDIEWGNTIESIGVGAFSGCSAFQNMKITAPVKSIGEHAFWGMASLKSVELPNTVESVGNEAFSQCSSLESVRWSSNCPRIGWATFPQCNSLKAITNVENVTYIEQSAFAGCKSLVEWPAFNSLQTMEWGAFWSCENLKAVIYPASFKEDGGAFPDCKSIRKVTSKAIEPFDIDFDSEVYELGTLYVPKGCIQAYQTFDGYTSGWMQFKHLGGEFATGDIVYLYADNEERITVKVVNETDKTAEVAISPNGYINGPGPGGTGHHTVPTSAQGLKIIGIGDNAYSCNEDLKSITIPDGITYIGKEAFWFCYNMTNAEMGNTVSEMGMSAFSNCLALERIKLSSSLTKIEDGVFLECPILKEVTNVGHVKEIGEHAFYDCKALVNWPDFSEVEIISQSAFYNCENLEAVVFPANFQSVGTDAFAGCKNIKTVTTLTPTPFPLGHSYDYWDDIFEADVYFNAKLYIVKGAWNTYRQAALDNEWGWIKFENWCGYNSDGDILYTKTDDGTKIIIKVISADNMTAEIVHDELLPNYTEYCLPWTESFTIPTEINGYKITGLADGALRNAPILHYLTIPSQIEYIHGNPFPDWQLFEIHVAHKNPLPLEETALAQSYTTVYVPKGCKTAYMSAVGWNMAREIIEEDAASETGDVNGDGTVNVIDIMSIVNGILGKSDANINQDAADVNQDGKIDISDVVKIITIITSTNP